MCMKAIGRIDVHSHLIPGVDDGCKSVDESIACAKVLVAHGYTHSFCTPHVWPNLPGLSAESIPKLTAELQLLLDAAGVPLRLIPGGELNLRPDLRSVDPERIVTYGMAGQFCLFDLWAEELPEYFVPSVRWLQSLGLKVILAHPERMRAVQLEPELADLFAEIGLLLQGNLQCFSDPVGSATRTTAERYLREDRYFMLGSDLHQLKTLEPRMAGLRRAAT